MIQYMELVVHGNVRDCLFDVIGDIDRELRQTKAKNGAKCFTMLVS